MQSFPRFSGKWNKNMAKNTNPITKKIYGQNSWSTTTWNGPCFARAVDDYHDIFIKKLIHGIFQKYKYLTSDVQIKKFATGNIEISWLFLPLSFGEEKSFKKRQISKVISKRSVEGGQLKISKVVVLIAKIIKSILILKFGNIYSFKIIQAPNLFSNSKLVADYINRQLTQDPRQHRYVLNKLTWDFKKAQKTVDRRHYGDGGSDVVSH